MKSVNTLVCIAKQGRQGWNWLGIIGGLWLAPLVARSLTERLLCRTVRLDEAPMRAIPGVLVSADRLWRGPAPDGAYEALAAVGVSLIVDMRAEADIDAIAQEISDAGLSLCWLPTPNTRAPTPRDLETFETQLDQTDGVTYVHCEAGEGRTGAILGALEVRHGSAVSTSLLNALSVGSLTISQMFYIARAGRTQWLCATIDWLIDRPSEHLLDIFRR